MKKTVNFQKPIVVIQYLLMFVSVFFLVLSLWKLLTTNNLLPYSVFLIGSILNFLMYLALIISGLRGKILNILTTISILNSVLICLFYFYNELLRQFYPLSIWIVLIVIVFSLQGVLEKKNKTSNKKMRYINYGFLVLLSPLLILKFSNPDYWSIIGWTSVFVILTNLIVYFLPSKAPSNQSK